MTGVYIHIPFCLRKCPYCDFFSVRYDKNTVTDYVSALCRNISNEKFKGINIDTIYFGGGTPSALTATQVDEILSACRESFVLAENTEITMECNPSSTDKQKLQGYLKCGVTRLSFGIQSAEDSQLEFLGRLHSFEKAVSVINTAKSVGFENISADIMLGLENQTPQSLAYTLDRFVNLPIKHISAYMLKIEEGTPFDCDKVRNVVSDEDELSDMYLQTVETLEDKGFLQYEISNFAVAGYESRHNLKYWTNEDYIGFGTSAHSLLSGRRYFVPDHIREYISLPFQREIDEAVAYDEREEYLMLALRLTQGAEYSQICRLYGNEFVEKIKTKAELYERNFMTVCDKFGFHLTPKGFLVSNAIISSFLD